jgi:hypothetical protein
LRKSWQKYEDSVIAVNKPGAAPSALIVAGKKDGYTLLYGIGWHGLQPCSQPRNSLTPSRP